MRTGQSVQAKDLFRRKIRCLALEIIVQIWLEKCRLELNKTPRSLTSSNCFKQQPDREKEKLDGERRFDMSIQLHLAGDKGNCHVKDQSVIASRSNGMPDPNDLSVTESYDFKSTAKSLLLTLGCK